MGLLAIFVFLFPYLYLRENAYFIIHDELDDGIIKYMLNAKHFGDNSNFIPEFMGGQSKNSIVVSSFWGIILYKFLTPYNAFLVMMVLSVMTGYVGVFLLGKELSENAFASFFTASVFSYLPFRSMFALNIVGFPIFIWAMIKLAREKGKKIIIPFLMILYYSSGITMVCGGYIAIGFSSIAIAVIALIKFINHKREKQNIKVTGINTLNMAIAEIILCVTQLVMSFDLIKSTFIANSYISHREEMDPTIRVDYIKHFLQMMNFGGSHAECCSWVISISSLILVCIFPILFILFIKKKAKDTEQKLLRNKYYAMCGFYLANVFNSTFSCIWMSTPVVSFREKIGGVLRTFQFDRICWIMPTCWMCVLVLELAIILDIAKIIFSFKPKGIKGLSIIPTIIAITIIFVYSKNVYFSSVIYHNLRLIAFPESYHVDTWRDYYAEDLFKDITQAIRKDRSEYRVASVALNPAVTLYNGFYTIDGYSTDYPLEYKHRFRKIIADELYKDETIRYYFDSWGSRCYIFSSEVPISTGLNNNSDIIESLSIDTEELKNMGADYIFSNAKILNSDELNLLAIKDSAFERAPYKYKIWVYEIQ